MVGTIDLLSMSSFIAIDPNTSPCPKGSTTLQQGRCRSGLCWTCLTQIGIGRISTFLSKGRIGYTDGRSGLLCPMASKILGVL